MKSLIDQSELLELISQANEFNETEKEIMRHIRLAVSNKIGFITFKVGKEEFELAVLLKQEPKK